MVDPTAPPSTNVRAAEAIITYGTRATELENVEARVSELELAVGGETVSLRTGWTVRWE
jgi:hypothetical protein